MTKPPTLPTGAQSLIPKKELISAIRNAYSNQVPLGLPDQRNGMPTSPIDRGDETQDRFRYQWAIGVHLLAEIIARGIPVTALWCEHHDDFLVELSAGTYQAIQVKTDSSENAQWKLNSEAFLKSLKRFCSLEENFGEKIDQYQFASNAPVYVPQTGQDPKEVTSPMRLQKACTLAPSYESIAAPFEASFNKLTSTLGVEKRHLFAVLRKLVFRQGPPLRGYWPTIVSTSIPALPNCSALPMPRLQHIAEELMRLVEEACGIPRLQVDGVLAYIASNGRPENAIRGKCITLDSARTSIEQASKVSYRYVGCSGLLPIGKAQGQKQVLQRKMQSAFIGGQFEPMWIRVLSTEERLMEQAVKHPETFESLATQLTGVVLMECKDIEALQALEPDEKKRGVSIYRDIVERLGEIAENDSPRVGNEPKDTLLGVAGMLSGGCHFAWGVPLEEDHGGS